MRDVDADVVVAFTFGEQQGVGDRGRARRCGELCLEDQGPREDRRLASYSPLGQIDQ